MKRYFCFLLAPFLLGCAPHTTIPLEKMEFRAGDKPAKHLVVLLSGRGAKASYFKDNKWVELARAQGVQADFIAPHAHFGYYLKNELVPRLNQDVILPAKQQGYETISLVGISMGGLGSVSYSERFPEDIEQLYLIAPYLGDREIQDEIRSEGGLANWQIKKENEGDWKHNIWRYLKQMTEDGKTRKKIFLGFGDKDHLAGHNLLAENIPAEHVIKIPGGHKDVVFTRVWEIMLEKGFLDMDKKVAVNSRLGVVHQ